MVLRVGVSFGRARCFGLSKGLAVVLRRSEVSTVSNGGLGQVYGMADVER